MPRRSALSGQRQRLVAAPGARERPGERVVSVHGRASSAGLASELHRASWLNPVVGSVHRGLEIDLHAVRREQPVDDRNRLSLSPGLDAPTRAVEQLGVQRDGCLRRDRLGGSPGLGERAPHSPARGLDPRDLEPSQPDTREVREARPVRGGGPPPSVRARARAWRSPRACTPSARAGPRRRRARAASPPVRRPGSPVSSRAYATRAYEERPGRSVTIRWNAANAWS